MKIYHLIAAVFFVIFGASSANAGGALTDYSPPPQLVSACGGTFSGFYAGGIFGFGGASTTTSADIVGGGRLNLKDNDRSFTAGGIAGYNWQCNGRLIGVESDLSYFNADMTTGVICNGAPCGSGSSLTFGSEVNWYGTLRGRLGLVGDENFLIFATGGLAYGGLDHSLRSNGYNGVTFSGANSDSAIGWTAGGGIDYRLSDNWAFRADAMYVDFGSDDETFTATSGSGCTSVTTCTLKASYDDHFWVARVGLTYLFGGTPQTVVPEYAPLK
jgi:outer membrane immunogenic protein